MHLPSFSSSKTNNFFVLHQWEQIKRIELIFFMYRSLYLTNEQFRLLIFRIIFSNIFSLRTEIVTFLRNFKKFRHLTYYIFWKKKKLFIRFSLGPKRSHSFYFYLFIFLNCSFYFRFYTHSFAKTAFLFFEFFSFSFYDLNHVKFVFFLFFFKMIIVNISNYDRRFSHFIFVI